MYVNQSQNEDLKKYAKAMHDIREAQKSIYELSNYQKECLFKELFGEEMFRKLVNLYNSSQSGGR